MFRPRTNACVHCVHAHAEEASLLGYKSHAAFVLEVRMAKTPEAVLQFLDTLNKNLAPIYEKEKAELLKLKQEEQKARGEPVEAELFTWDRTYYTRLWTERAFKVDQEEVKEYFPLDIVTKGTDRSTVSDRTGPARPAGVCGRARVCVCEPACLPACGRHSCAVGEPLWNHHR